MTNFLFISPLCLNWNLADLQIPDFTVFLLRTSLYILPHTKFLKKFQHSPKFLFTSSSSLFYIHARKTPSPFIVYGIQICYPLNWFLSVPFLTNESFSVFIEGFSHLLFLYFSERFPYVSRYPAAQSHEFIWSSDLITLISIDYQ